ncbi:hypothetical protein [Stenotrophomonas sp. SORGH_AS_0321]|uniref:hypothetical protein n=1 Tax=Stenotrophomonas sp. SORGH_AS_0321 TaxID=3041787 RepID=UPI002860A09C|nr:hypothetical protein [Stenotrophomonas sp. SORGH_AS_0321]MDR6094921.1 hypothetical protein [Stenotrophomonas sp. SORGH_AS_0321]
MARIRSIKPEFWSSEQVMECSPTSRLLFIGLWNFCDDAGNHVASAKTIKAEIFPGDDISSTDVQRMLDELSSNSLIAFYANGDKQYLHVTGWKKHQKIDRPTFKHPAYSSDDRRGLDESSPPEGKGEEGKGEERKKNPPNPPADAEGRKPTRSKREKITFPAFVEACREAGERAIRADDPIFDFAEDAGIPREFIALAWREFALRHRDSGRQQKDWRAHFRDAVRRNWFKLWWCPEGGGCELTTSGVQVKRERDAERAREQAEQADQQRGQEAA